MEQTPLILVVDDEQNFLEIFRAKLTAEGYRVETATGGVAGIARAKELKPNLILMDVKMPDMEGTKAAMLLREDEDLKDTKIVFLTSLGDGSADREAIDQQFAESANFTGYLKKTDDLDAIVAKLKTFLR